MCSSSTLKEMTDVDINSDVSVTHSKGRTATGVVDYFHTASFLCATLLRTTNDEEKYDRNKQYEGVSFLELIVSVVYGCVDMLLGPKGHISRSQGYKVD